MTTLPREAPPFTALDWIAAVAAGLAALGLLSFPILGRSFAGMYRDFGSPAHLPALTRLAVTAWFPLSLGILVAVAVLAGAARRLPLGARRACIVVGFLVGGIGLALCVVGVYLPVFQLAGAVKAE